MIRYANQSATRNPGMRRDVRWPGRRTRTLRLLGLKTALGVLVGCAGQHEPMPPVDFVDLERFMGDWYVIANIPTALEKTAHNAVENYTLEDDGTIATTFTFRDGSFDGELKKYTPRGFVREGTGNAVWGMRFIWPIKADYRIVYLDADYSVTIIGRLKRDYVWLMARTPSMAADQYAARVAQIAELGYDVDKLQRVPQNWSDPAP